MTHTYNQFKKQLLKSPKTWLITGVAGFIGSHLLETLLGLNQKIIGLDNLSTGRESNLQDVKSKLPAAQWSNFEFVRGDIRDLTLCKSLTSKSELVLHQAALGSVPRSIADPLSSAESNIQGTLNMLIAARDASVKRFVYASSSSVYGDSPDLPKVEEKVGTVLSPYALTKAVAENYARLFQQHYGLISVGLRYFNVFGPRQDPQGAYAAVIPKWIATLMNGQTCIINGDGKTSRDFCYVKNVVQANILAALTPAENLTNYVFNIACHNQLTLTDLFSMLRSGLIELGKKIDRPEPQYADFRSGDIRHSFADITKAEKQLGYQPAYQVADGINETVCWFANN